MIEDLLERRYNLAEKFIHRDHQPTDSAEVAAEDLVAPVAALQQLISSHLEESLTPDVSFDFLLDNSQGFPIFYFHQFSKGKHTDKVLELKLI